MADGGGSLCVFCPKRALATSNTDSSRNVVLVLTLSDEDLSQATPLPAHLDRSVAHDAGRRRRGGGLLRDFDVN